MRSYLITTLLLCTALQSATAQTITDKELGALVDVVKMLRTRNEATYNKARQILSADSKWTPMNETGGRQEGECRPADVVDKFKLNRILTNVEGSRKYVTTHGDMLNGEDERYNYSLYERTVKAGAKVTYKIKGREGRQTFVVVPFAQGAPALSASVSIDQKPIGKFVMEDGILVAECSSEAITRDREIVLTIENKNRSANQAFVILNHNTRKP